MPTREAATEQQDVAVERGPGGDRARLLLMDLVPADLVDDDGGAEYLRAAG